MLGRPDDIWFLVVIVWLVGVGSTFAFCLAAWFLVQIIRQLFR